MSNSDQNQTEPSRDEQLFIQRALAGVEKAERYQNIKRLVATLFIIAFALQFAFRPTSSEMRIEATIMIFVGLVAVICTTRILSRVNKNTKDILQAMLARR